MGIIHQSIIGIRIKTVQVQWIISPFSYKTRWFHAFICIYTVCIRCKRWTSHLSPLTAKSWHDQAAAFSRVHFSWQEGGENWVKLPRLKIWTFSLHLLRHHETRGAVFSSQDVVRARAGAHDYKVAPRPAGDPRNWTVEWRVTYILVSSLKVLSLHPQSLI